VQFELQFTCVHHVHGGTRRAVTCIGGRRWTCGNTGQRTLNPRVRAGANWPLKRRSVTPTPPQEPRMLEGHPIRRVTISCVILFCFGSNHAHNADSGAMTPAALELVISRAEQPIIGTVLGGKVAASGGCGWGAVLGCILATGPGWRQGKGPARMRCSDAGRPSPGTTGVVGFGQPEAVSVAVKGSWSALFGGSNWSVRMSVHSACPTPLASTVMPL
jgi:hypothetical protein